MNNYFAEIGQLCFDVDFPIVYRRSRDGEILGYKNGYVKKLPIIFGSLKHHWQYFWTTDDINEINDAYHELLVKANGFQIEALDIFTSKQYRQPVKNTFFKDCSNDPGFLIDIMEHIKYNNEALKEIIKRGLKYSFGDDIEELYKSISLYLEEEKRKGNLEIPPRSYANTRSKPLYKTSEEVEKKVYDDALYSIHYVDNLMECAKAHKEFEWIIIDIDGSKLSCPDPKIVQLLPSSIKLLKTRLNGIEKANVQTCLDLLDHYECFVDKKHLEEFKSNLEAHKYSLNSLYENDDAFLKYAIQLIKKYYSFAAVAAYIENERTNYLYSVIIQFRESFRHNKEWQDPARVCFFIDCLSYCFKKGYEFIDKECYLKLNAIMRYLNHGFCTSYWYCFDPMNAGEWRQVFEHNKINDNNYGEVCRALKAIIEQNISIKSDLVLDIFKIASEQYDFKVVVQLINKVFKKRNIKKKKK